MCGRQHGVALADSQNLGVVDIATVHIDEIRRWLAANGQADALPWSGGGMYLEIRFDDDSPPTGVVDEELANRTITGNCPQGNVTIGFDGEGDLEYLEIS